MEQILEQLYRRRWIVSILILELASWACFLWTEIFSDFWDEKYHIIPLFSICQNLSVGCKWLSSVDYLIDIVSGINLYYFLKKWNQAPQASGNYFVATKPDTKPLVLLNSGLHRCAAKNSITNDRTEWKLRMLNSYSSRTLKCTTASLGQRSARSTGNFVQGSGLWAYCDTGNS